MFGKLSDLGGSLKKAAEEAKKKLEEAAVEYEVTAKLSKATESLKEASAASAEKMTAVLSTAKEEAHAFDYQQLKDVAFYQERFTTSTVAMERGLRSTLEIDKASEDIINDIRSRLPSTAENLDDIFAQCKKEAIRRAIASFGLSSMTEEIDRKHAAMFSDLSVEYKDYKKETNLHDHENFAAMKDERYEARENFVMLEDGYNADNSLNPYSTDIDHVVPKQAFYDDLLIRAGTTDDGMIDAINSKGNLVFADESVNRSKGAKDLMDFAAGATPDDWDADLLHMEIQDADYMLRQSDVEGRYQDAREEYSSARVEALKTLGGGALDAGARMALQQVVGMLVIETVDIFIDEVRDISSSGLVLDADALKREAAYRKARIMERLQARIEERDLARRIKDTGIEAGVAGALAVIPQIIISLITQLPAFILGIIREGTLSVIRCTKILLSDRETKFEDIKIIMAGTASAVFSIYVSSAVSQAVAPVPLLNVFNRQITDVLAGVVVTAVPLSAIYVFDQNRSNLVFSIKSWMPGSA